MQNKQGLPPNTTVAIRQEAFMQNIRALMSDTNFTRGLVDTWELDDSPTTDKTQIMSAIPKEPIKPIVITPPSSIEYRSANDPLTMLHGACVTFAQRYKHLPEVLFVSPLLVPLLELLTPLVTGKEYDGRFYMFSVNAIDGRTQSFPVLTEEVLPPILRLAYGGGSIGRDSVIAASER